MDNLKQKNMTVLEGLKDLKFKRNELQRKIDIRRNNFNVIIPKDESLDTYDDYIKFEDLTEEIEQIDKDIRTLRERIELTNMKTIIPEVNGIRLGALKLRVDSLASKLNLLENLKAKDSFFGTERRITKSDEEEKKVSQLSDLELEDRIKNIEEEKRKLESLLEKTNATTNLLTID